MPTEISLRRSQLGIPGNERELVATGLESNADEIFLDLEDSLAPEEKQSAREVLIDIIQTHEWKDTNLSYRINGTRTRWWYDDVIEVIDAVGREIDSLIIPKVRDSADIITVATLVSSVETSAGIEEKSIKISAQIETASGMNAVTEISQASERLGAIIFGPADYSASIGATHGATEYPGHYWHYPLSRISHAAASAGLMAIGGPYTASENEGDFRDACNYERALGYDGKIVIHPEQVTTANEVFSPNAEDTKRAKQIIKKYEAADANAIPAIDGKVIDREMYQMAKQILRKAELADLV